LVSCCRLRPVRVCIVLTSLLVAACGESPASTTSPTPADDYIGTWTGFTRLEGCSLGSSRLDCVTSFLPAPAIAITLDAAPNRNVQGTVHADNYRFTVTGSRQPDGSLTLSGTGTNVGAAITLTAWNTRDSNGVMTGRFSFHSEFNINNPVGDVTYTLDRVVRPGVTVPPFTGERLSLRASPIRANRFPPSGPSQASYSACGVILNDGPVSVTIPTLTITPIGANGNDYPVTQTIPQGFRPRVVDRGHALSGCGFASATDFDVTHPTAAQYRFRIEYVYDDGVSGVLESVGAVTGP
jgi:hypothetical protein